ncbi:site-2 protease family protein [bacterium]|nr:site-2 protease family protein [bacterium]
MTGIGSFLIWVPPILLAITFHEFSHGYAAYLLGDPTAAYAGRLSLNPLRHLDPLGTIMLLFAHIGWAKPVPIDPRNFKNPKRGILLTSVAGPASNMLLAFLFGLLYRLWVNLFPPGIYIDGSTLHILAAMLLVTVRINLILAVFNLIPIPPLDGSKILFGLLPREYDRMFYQLEMMGPFLLIGLIIFSELSGLPILSALIYPFVGFFTKIFAGV